MNKRIERPDLYHGIAHLVALRGTCPRAQVGAVIVKDKRIISMGYNGAPPGMPHCTEVGCETPNEGCDRAIHAEANALTWAARAGTSVEGASMFCTHAPCYKCAQLIVSSGIIEVSYEKAYRDTRGLELLDDASVVIP